MRIVSQNGKNDIPYEMCLLAIEEVGTYFWIYASGKFDDVSGLVLGTYNTLEKALRVMEMIRENNLLYEYDNAPQFFYFYMPQDNEVE